MAIRRGWAVRRVTDSGEILAIVRVFVGQRAEMRARAFCKNQKELHTFSSVTVEEPDKKSRAIYSVRRLPMDESFDDLEIVGTTCVMGTLTSIKVQTPQGILYRTSLTSSLRSELNRLSVVRGTRIKAVSSGRKHTIHQFEITKSREDTRE